MKRIEVAAAVICEDDKIFATQQGYGEWKDWWEFPGGKIEAGETPEEAHCSERFVRNCRQKSVWIVRCQTKVLLYEDISILIR